MTALDQIADRDAPSDAEWENEGELLAAVRASAVNAAKYIQGCFDGDEIEAFVDATVAARATPPPDMDGTGGSPAACGACGTMGLVETMMFGTGFAFLRVNRRRRIKGM